MKLNPELLKRDWSKEDWKRGVTIPERMVALNHPKAERLLTNMAIKYSILQHYLAPNATVLDVGCGSGYGLSLLSTMGYQPIGCDINPRHVQIAEMRGFPVLPQPVESLDIKVDAVTSVDMIEHVEQVDQPRVIKGMVEKIRPGGYLLVDTCFRWESARVSRDHVWELGYYDFRSLIMDAGVKIIDHFCLIRAFDKYSVLTKAHPETLPNDRNEYMILDQIIVACV